MTAENLCQTSVPCGQLFYDDLSFGGGNVPFFPKVSADGDSVGQAQTEHSCGCPAVEDVGVGRIGSIRIPNWREMSAAAIGAVSVLSELEGRVCACNARVQEAPIGLVVELWKICHSILRSGDSGILIGAYLRGGVLAYAISAFE